MSPFLILLAATSTAHARQSEDLHGKTEAQILAMGSKRWIDYATGPDRSGEPASQMRAEYIAASNAYCSAARKRNERLLAALKTPDAGLRKKLAHEMVRFSDTMFDLLKKTDSGNWMESARAAQDCDAQDAVYAYLHPEGQKREKPMLVSGVSKILAKWKVKIDKRDGDLLFDNEDNVQAATRKLGEAKAIYHDIVILVSKTTGRAGSDRVLAFCAEAAQNLNGF